MVLTVSLAQNLNNTESTVLLKIQTSRVTIMVLRRLAASIVKLSTFERTI
jgi:hypothetical protein